MDSEYVPCKHLDYDLEKYGQTCTLVQLEDGVKYWNRNHPPYPEAVREVQFCGLGRGRINSIFDCYSVHGAKARMTCHEAEEKENSNGE